jgi:hypothetical protein
MWTTRTTFPKRNSQSIATGILGGRRHGVRHETRCRRPGRGASSGARWAASREAVKRSGTGGRVPPPGWPCGVRWPEDASDNEPNMRLARELHVRRALVTASVMLPRVFPEGTSGEGGTQLAGRVLDWMQHYPAHVTCSRRTSSSRDQPPAGCLVARSEDLWGELLEWA